MFGLLISNLGETEIFEPICHGIANAPEAGSYALLWGHTAADAASEQQAFDLCRQYIDLKVFGFARIAEAFTFVYRCLSISLSRRGSQALRYL